MKLAEKDKNIQLKAKIDRLNQQAWDVRVNDSPKAFALSRQSLKLARSIRYKKGIAEGCRSMGFCYVRLSKNDEALPLLNESLSLFKEINDLKGQAVINEYLAVVKRNQGELGPALELLFKAVSLSHQTGSAESEAIHHYQLGVTYKYLGNFDKALESLFKSISIHKENKNRSYQSYPINVMGSIYFETGDFKKALSYFKEGLLLRQESGDKLGQAGSLDNIGYTLFKLKKFTQALNYCKQSLAMSRKTGDKRSQANALQHIAEIQAKAGDIKQAILSSNASRAIRKATGDKRGEAEILLLLAGLPKQDPQQVSEWLVEALKIAKETPDLQSRAHYCLYDHYKQAGKFKEANRELEKHYALEKKLHKNAVNQKMINLEITRKAEETRKEAAALNQKNTELTRLNKELEIEAALERVRAQAMAMHRPDDIMNICKTIFKELPGLGFTDVRNTLINYWDDANASLIDYDYSDLTGANVARLSYSSHPVFEQFQKKIRSSKDAFAELVVTKDQLASWRKRRRDSGEYEDPRLKKIDALYYYFYSIGLGAVGISTFKPLSSEHIQLLKRFRNVFDLAYRRYLDIEKAEAQAREAQIQLALERVRARTMAMKKSDELLETSAVLFEQMKQLGEPVQQYTIGIVRETEAVVEVSATIKGSKLTETYRHPVTEPYVMKKILKSWKEGRRSLILELKGKELAAYNRYRNDRIVGKKMFPEKVPANERRILHVGFFSTGMMSFATTEPRPDESIQLLERFAMEFDHTYKRFLDLQKAEAQARESQIELGLERVRARALAMQNSDELKGLIGSVFTELTKLDLVLTRCLIMIFSDQDSDSKWWMANSEDPDNPAGFYIKAHNLPPNVAYFKAWRERKIKNTYILEGKIKKDWDLFLFTETELKNLPAFVIEGMKAPDKVYLNASFNNFGNLTLASLEPLSEEHFDILLRFAKVFDLTYTRFNDLQKAEAQAKESKVQLALERVRARTMAMQHSTELSETVKVMFDQFKDLGEEPERMAIEIVNEKEKVFEIWATQHGGSQLNLLMKATLNEPHVMQKMYKAWKKKLKSITIDLQANELEEYFQFLKKNGLPVERKIFGKRRVQNVATFSKGILTLITHEPRPKETIALLERFANVFDGTYTRFLDLQKAEAQAKEAQVQLALERGRAQTMMMQHSSELDDTLRVFHEQVLQLNIPSAFSFLWLPDEEKNNHIFWAAWKEDHLFKSKAINYPLDRNEPATAQCLIDWKSNEPVVAYHVPPEGVQNYFFAWSELIAGVEELNPQHFRDGLYYVEAFMKYGCFGVIVKNALADDEKKILERLTTEFERAYTRFLDLQKAEAQAREAQIEAALERVRSKTMAMHNSQEVGETVGLMFDELQRLGVETLRCGIGVMHPNNAMEVMTARSDEGKTNLVIGWIDMNLHPLLQGAYRSWTNKNESYSYLLKDDDLLDYFNAINSHPDYPVRYNMDNLPRVIYHNEFYFPEGTLFAFSKEQPSEEVRKIFKRFAGVFGQTYRRYLDLQKAEAQAREAEIELALERVRARTMAMQQHLEFEEVIKVIGEQFVHLGFDIDWVNFGASGLNIGEGIDVWNFAVAPDGQTFSGRMLFPYVDHPVFTIGAKGLENFKKTGADLFEITLAKKEKDQWLDHLYSNTIFKAQPEEIRKLQYEKPGYTTPVLLLKETFLSIGKFDIKPFTAEQQVILRRIGKSFGQAYTRFLDLQKAEAQSRESQIQLALERVRARTMAMQKSDELPEAANLLFQQIQSLGMPAWSAGYCTWNDDERRSVTLWMSSEGVVQPPFTAPTTEDELFIETRKGAEQGKTLHIVEIGGEKLVKHYRYMRTLPVMDEMLDAIIAAGHPLPTFQIMHQAYFSKGFLLFITYEPVPEAHDIFKRFANVFEQTYTRFLDLQKAEAQAREAKIEAALEKVRSRSLAMHKSDEIKEVVKTTVEKIQELDIEMNGGISIVTYEPGSKDFHHWLLIPGALDDTFKAYLPWVEHKICYDVIEAREKGIELYANVYSGDEKKTYFEFLFNKTDFGGGPEELKAWVMGQPYFGFSFAIQKHSGIFLNDYSGNYFSKETNDILVRFSRVFEQSYIRFLDLKKVEAQAREAQIEAALERVRSKAMAMQKSDDLANAVGVVFEELDKLNLGMLRCGIGILHKETRCANVWTTTKSDNDTVVQVTGDELMDVHPLLTNAFDAWERQEDHQEYILKGEDLHAYYKALIDQHFYLPDSQSYVEGNEGLVQYYYNALFSAGGLFAFRDTPFPEEAKMVLRRFADVFTLTYTRFLDLQKAEAQAREANIETGLERVRSRTLAMQSSEELAETAAVLFQQLILLGIQPNRLYIGIIEDDKGKAEFWITDEDGSKVSSAFETNLNNNSTLKKMFDGWKEERRSLILDMQGEELQDYLNYLSSIHVPFKGGREQKRRIQDIAYFSKGFIGMASPDDPSQESIQLLERFAAVFNLTFTRFNDLKIAESHAVQAEEDLIKLQTEKKRAEDALAELQVTQKQLIQSEKMASLGELTAGIAHEIQNPLNFVNNFSEVSNELLDEMIEEVKKGNFEEVQALVNDVKQNLEKINHHGKRADGIVKGMLQHSRSSSTTKEPTDINKLADEYLRLAYHGLRAKDKTFNATMKTEYDETVGSISVMSQDIGRVILNLITNAFYVVGEKKKLGEKGYEPTVSVSTKRTAGWIEIRVMDNGNGIPAHVLDKIFQPFFTTKPTGQGTGLGLSLSYDIVKAHGGELKVETNLGQGSVFIIQLPLN